MSDLKDVFLDPNAGDATMNGIVGVSDCTLHVPHNPYTEIDALKEEIRVLKELLIEHILLSMFRIIFSSLVSAEAAARYSGTILETSIKKSDKYLPEIMIL